MRIGKYSIYIYIMLAAVLVAGGVWWNRQAEPSAVLPVADLGQRPIHVVATVYPLQQLTEAIIGDRGTVIAVVSVGVEPHDYEPLAQDVKSAYQADIFVLNGAGLDPWAERLKPELEHSGVAVVRFADLFSPLPFSEGRNGGDTAVPDVQDPHFWLDPTMARQGVVAITASLVNRFPEEKAEFETRRDRFIAELQRVDTEYQTGLAHCRVRTIVTTHNAFGYLAKRYNFEIRSIVGLSPETEPSPRRLADLSAEMQALGIRYVLFETLVSPKIAETLARSTGVETLILNPIEGITDEERRRGETYLSLMEKNLSTLRKALECT